MAYWLLQVGALLLLAYFLGALAGCMLRRLFAVDQPVGLRDAGLATAAAGAGVAAPAIKQSLERTIARNETDVVISRRTEPAPAPATAPAPAPATAVVSDAVTDAYEADTIVDVEDDEDEAPVRTRELDIPPAPPAVVAPPAAEVLATSARAAADDLKRIRGIGPDIEEQLNAHGIWRFEEIAGWRAADVQTFDRELAFRGRISREGWIEQAQILARGASTAFSRRIDNGEVGNIMQAAWSTTAAARSLDDLVVATPGPHAGDELPDDVTRQRQAVPTARLVQDQQEREHDETLQLQREARQAEAREHAEREARAAAEQQRIEREAANAERERLQREAREHDERMRLAQEREAAEQAERTRLAREREAAEQAERMRLAQEREAAEQAERMRLAQEREAAEQAERTRLAREREAAEQAERTRLAQEREAAEQAARAQAAREQVEREAQERARREAEQRQRQAREAELAARAERDRLEREVLARQDLERAAAMAAATALATGVLASGGTASAERKQDDLKRIRTIDGEIERALRELGITRYEQIAALGPDDVDAVNARIGASDRVEREGWIEQAQVLAKGVETSYARRLRENNERSARAARQQQAGALAATGATGATPGGSPARGRSDTSVLRSVRSERLVGDRRDDPRSAGDRGAGDRGAGDRSAGDRGGRVLRAAQPDDLKRIRGVGVVIEKKLFGLGITSYQQIAGWSEDDVAKVSEHLAFSGRIEREGWIEQAKVLARGGETAFSRRVDRGEVDTSRNDS